MTDRFELNRVRAILEDVDSMITHRKSCGSAESRETTTAAFQADISVSARSNRKHDCLGGTDLDRRAGGHVCAAFLPIIRRTRGG